MKKIISVISLLFLSTFLFSKEIVISIPKGSSEELDKIELNNCTTLDKVIGYLSYKDTHAIGFSLKEIGDKYTACVSDWKSYTDSIKIHIFEVNENIDLKIYSHWNDNDLYIAIVEVNNEYN